MTGCCARRAGTGRLSARLDVHDCFGRGLATRRVPPLSIAGARIDSPSGFWAAFSPEHEAGELRDIRFSAPICTTLIAYCQALVDLGRGCSLGEARTLDARGLIAGLHGVPEVKHDRAVLAVAAFRAALINAEESLTGGNAA